MIVPQNRLIMWTGLVFVPCAALAAALPQNAELPAAGVVLFLMMVLIDAVRARKILTGVSVEFSPTARMIKDREGTIDVRIGNTGSAKQLLLGLSFPPHIAPAREELLLAVPGEMTSLFTWPCTPLARGRHVFETCYLESSSEIGFWALRAAVPAAFEVRVYPNLFPERRNLSALFLGRGDFGVHVRRQAGPGREFEKLREYVHGDAYEHIHWKTTAKRGRPVTKLFQIERTQEVYVIIDASRLSSRPAHSGRPGQEEQRETILERFITAALVMGMAAERQGDLFGIATFSDRVHTFVRAKSGRAHYTTCRDAIYGLQPRVVTPDFDEICSFIGLRLRRRALLVFLTNLDDPVLAESFERNMEMLRKKHLVLVGMLRPSAAHPLFTRTDTGTFDDLYRDLAGHLLWHDLRELEKVLRRRGVQFFLLDHERLCPQLVSRYIDVKQGQLI